MGTCSSCFGIGESDDKEERLLGDERRVQPKREKQASSLEIRRHVHAAPRNELLHTTYGAKLKFYIGGFLDSSYVLLVVIR
jgi:hypothetical protein